MKFPQILLMEPLANTLPSVNEKASEFQIVSFIPSPHFLIYRLSYIVQCVIETMNILSIVLKVFFYQPIIKRS